MVTCLPPTFLLVILLASVATSQRTLDCVETPVGCQEGPITITNPETLTLQWNLSSEFVGGVYVILRSAVGNADLFKLSPPSGSFLSSGFNNDEDRVYVPVLPGTSMGGKWTMIITSVTRTSTFTLTVRAVNDVPSLNPKDTAALAAFTRACCTGSSSNPCRSLLTTKNICTLPYMYCDPQTQSLLTLNLAGANDMTNTMTAAPFSCAEAPAALGMFTMLDTVDLSYLWGVNWTMESISKVVAPSKIKRLYLNGNQVSGELPCELFTGIGNGTALEALWLQDNRGITGTIPACIFSSNLVDLALSGNQLRGPLPNAIPTTSKLRLLQIENQQYMDNPTLAGSIPPSIKNAQQLYFLSLQYNSFQGTIPPMPPSIESIFLTYNRLSGSIPPHLLDLPNLLNLWLVGNQLTGAVHPGWGSKKGLQQLFLSSNKLEGNVDFDWSMNPDLIVLRLSNNQLTGAVPASLAKLPNLSMLRLQDNQLSSLDDFAAALSTQNQITVFNISVNSFSGPLPEGLQNLGVFNKPAFVEVNSGKFFAWNRTFDISSNNFTGPFPVWMLDKLDALSKESFFEPASFELRLQSKGNDRNRFTCPTEYSSTSGADHVVQTVGKNFGLTCVPGGQAPGTAKTVPLESVHVKDASSSKSSPSSLPGWAFALVVVLLVLVLAGIAGTTYYFIRIRPRRHAAAFTAFDEPGTDNYPSYGAIHGKMGGVEMRSSAV